MKITCFMVANYMLDCVLVGTRPCKYFQLNADHFNDCKGIFSKMDLDQMIPAEWKLAQRYDDGHYLPAVWPVFFKPEWGENAGGIYRADNEHEVTATRRIIAGSEVPYLIQQGATGSREFEIFSIQQPGDKQRHAVLSLTEVINEHEKTPINSIHNPHTRYQDLTDTLSPAEREKLWTLAGRIGRFAISRVSVRADSVTDLLAGRLQVIELNLFTPMPIHLLDRRYGIIELAKRIMRYMLILARVTKRRNRAQPEKAVYIKSMTWNRTGAIAKFLRARV